MFVFTNFLCSGRPYLISLIFLVFYALFVLTYTLSLVIKMLFSIIIAITCWLHGLCVLCQKKEKKKYPLNLFGMLNSFYLACFNWIERKSWNVIKIYPKCSSFLSLAHSLIPHSRKVCYFFHTIFLSGCKLHQSVCVGNRTNQSMMFNYGLN